MRKIKICCFTVSYTHSCIIANNFISRALENVKVIYISEKNEEAKLKNIVNRFYKKMDDTLFYTEWLNEKITNDYKHEKFVFVVSGKEDFVNRVNKYIDITEADAIVINCYDVFDIKEEIREYYCKT